MTHPKQCNIPENFKELCEFCNTHITKYDSCECGTTAVECFERDFNNEELQENY